jgi:hypothetical protein
MNYVKLVIGIFSSIYVMMRPILWKAVDDPEAEWDDRLMAAADALFGYEK